MQSDVEEYFTYLGATQFTHRALDGPHHKRVYMGSSPKTKQVWVAVYCDTLAEEDDEDDDIIPPNIESVQAAVIRASDFNQSASRLTVFCVTRKEHRPSKDVLGCIDRVNMTDSSFLRCIIVPESHFKLHLHKWYGHSRHSIVPNEEKDAAVRAMHRNQAKELSYLVPDDPMVKYLCALKGDIIRIETYSVPTGKQVLYKLVQYRT